MLFLPVLAKGERDVWWLLCYTSRTPSALRVTPSASEALAAEESSPFSPTSSPPLRGFLLIWPLLGFGLFSWVASVLWLMDAGGQMPGYFASICNSSDGPSSFTAPEGLAESFTANCLMVQLLLCAVLLPSVPYRCLSQNLLHRKISASMSVSREPKLRKKSILARARCGNPKGLSW